MSQIVKRENSGQLLAGQSEDEIIFAEVLEAIPVQYQTRELVDSVAALAISKQYGQLIQIAEQFSAIAHQQSAINQQQASINEQQAIALQKHLDQLAIESQANRQLTHHLINTIERVNAQPIQQQSPVIPVAIKVETNVREYGYTWDTSKIVACWFITIGALLFLSALLSIAESRRTVIYQSIPQEQRQ